MRVFIFYRSFIIKTGAMCFGLYYLLLMCDAPRNASIAVTPNNSTQNVTADVAVQPVVGASDKHKREVDLASILQDVQTRLPKGVPLPPIFHSPQNRDQRPSLVTSAEPKGATDKIEVPSLSSPRSVFIPSPINETEEPRVARPRKERPKQTNFDNSVEDEDNESDTLVEPPFQKFHLRRHPVIIPRRKYEGGYYRRRLPRRRVPYSRIRYVPYYDSEELPDSAEFFDDGYELPPPPVKTLKRRRHPLPTAPSTESQQESQDLRERLKEVLKQILDEANRPSLPAPMGMATGCHQKPVDN